MFLYLETIIKLVLLRVGHRGRMFHVDEINPKCKLDDGKVTRKSVSSSFCGMLNRGSGADCRSLKFTQT